MSSITYFAYGSNMSLSRLRARAPSARRLGCYVLAAHALRFHKSGMDGSGKCDAFLTADPGDRVVGVVFAIDPAEKAWLDEAEGLGAGYNEKTVTVEGEAGERLVATTYWATHINEMLKPYSWYKHHVLIGAREAGLPVSYIERIESVECLEDPDNNRDSIERAIHR